jgi:ribose 5-phosphate isomerase A
MNEMIESECYKLIMKSINASKVVGLGSGRALARFINSQLNQNDHSNIVFIVASNSTKQLIVNKKLKLGDIWNYANTIDVTIDGADSVFEDFIIKGKGGALLKEKIIIESSRKAFILVDRTKVKHLSVLPIEVHHMAVQKVLALENLRGVLRVDASGLPFTTESCNMIVDVHPENEQQYIDIDDRLKAICGVIETGLFLNNETIQVFVIA